MRSQQMYVIFVSDFLLVFLFVSLFVGMSAVCLCQIGYSQVFRVFFLYLRALWVLKGYTKRNILTFIELN